MEESLSWLKRYHVEEYQSEKGGMQQEKAFADVVNFMNG